ncbi:hypothetical protein O9H85_24755 [Paenibacillus filicis]|uniref:HIG1 domain-containing protein n=1 Tax=Paenibacillus gyeongsangnamensis TaxID=3388067 RepID=A0ABT4QFB1_9BACL|nr:hypothetical protein [Paenibacillus filicis]MCZ8515558.1 hypothetical protein [Paenibacillus filicis]
MSLYVYYTLFLLIMLFAAGATMVIGYSKKNTEGNPEYDKKTKTYWLGLSMQYIVAISAGLIALIIYIFTRH